MLTEQKVRAKIKACKILIKNCKANLTIDRMHDQMQNIFVVEILKHQKLRLKYLRRELPMRVKACTVTAVTTEGEKYPTTAYSCPICRANVCNGQGYCHCCGQRLERRK